MKKIMMQTFGHPSGMLGKLGGKLMARTAGKFAPWVVDLLAVQPSDHLLEVGFGSGLGIENLVRAAPNGQVAGIDYSEVMLQQASECNAAAIRAGRVDLRYGSAIALPWKDATFDRAMSTNSMQMWPDAVAGLREIRRVLKPQGVLALGFTPHSRQRTDVLVGLLAEAGFEQARLVKGELGNCALGSVAG